MKGRIYVAFFMLITLKFKAKKCSNCPPWFHGQGIIEI